MKELIEKIDVNNLDDVDQFFEMFASEIVEELEGYREMVGAKCYAEFIDNWNYDDPFIQFKNRKNILLWIKKNLTNKNDVNF